MDAPLRQYLSWERFPENLTEPEIAHFFSLSVDIQRAVQRHRRRSDHETQVGETANVWPCKARFTSRKIDCACIMKDAPAAPSLSQSPYSMPIHT
jgi:hypothetical protein